jgi:ferredoxin
MAKSLKIPLQKWTDFLCLLRGKYNVYAPVGDEYNIEYDLISEDNISSIIYNRPIPVSPLKIFFLPIKENVSKDSIHEKMNIIVGVPSCDLEALGILDEMYLREPFVDPYYEQRRKDTIVIGTDCYSIKDNCHCTSYDGNPFPTRYHDLQLSLIEQTVFFTIKSPKGEELIKNLAEENYDTVTQEEKEIIQSKREEIIRLLQHKNRKLPDYRETERLVRESEDEIWKKYSKTCVSCGACATICPTCTCFLLTDRPGFEKVRQLDACQYPGFEKTAGGEDPLKERFVRFRNRFLCKYVWKPTKFRSTACTGCGRCIDTCIGNINKNKLFVELKGR